MVEIRSYNLKPGTRDRFHQLFLKEALPMLRRWKVDVVAYGPSLHDQDSYFLMRAFDSVDERQKDEDAFYGSQEWIKGPRERVLADIDSYTTIVIHLDDATLQGLRKAGGQAMTGANDLEVLTKLNDDYIQPVQPRANQLHHRRRGRERRPLHRRLGAPERQVAGRVGARNEKVNNG